MKKIFGANILFAGRNGLKDIRQISNDKTQILILYCFKRLLKDR